MGIDVDVTLASAGFFNCIENTIGAGVQFSYERIAYTNFRAVRAPPKWVVCFLHQIKKSARITHEKSSSPQSL